MTLENVTELQRLRRIRSEFIDNLSHELRTPLANIRLLTEMLMDDLEREEVSTRVRERVATIDVETGHLVQMVNELLDLSRIEQAVDPDPARRGARSPPLVDGDRCTGCGRSPTARASCSSSWCPTTCRPCAATRSASTSCS